MNNFMIRSGENLHSEIRRIILLKIDYVLSIAENDQMDIHKRIHEIRRTCKIIRAVLRMTRDSMGYSTYFRENRFYRDLAGNLSTSRDFTVILQRAQYLKNNIPARLSDKNLESLIQIFSENRDLSLQKITENKELFTVLRMELIHARKRIELISYRSQGFDMIEKGIYRIYSQSRKYLKEVKKNRDEENIHEFRKRSKYLWYQLLFLRPCFPRMLKAYTKSLENISEEIGIHRDYSLFLENIKQNNYYHLSPSQIHFIIDFSNKEMDKILSRSINLSSQLFLDTPGLFLFKLKKYYETNLTMRLI